MENIKGTFIQEVTAILVKPCGGEPEPIEAVLSQTCETEVIFYIQILLKDNEKIADKKDMV